MVKGLIDSLGTENYMTAALSGKAVNVLSQRGIESATIHRMLGYKDGQFAHNEDNPLEYTVLGIDEMSMNDVSLLLSVLKAVADGTKLILVGDSGQLPAIGYGDVLRDLLATKIFPTYELTQVHRQAAMSGILSLANGIRRGNQVMPYNSSGREVFGELQDQTVISYSNKESIPSDVLKIAKGYLKSNIKQPEDIVDLQIIVPNREKGNLSVRSMNIELQKVFNDISKPFISRNGYDYREGDKVIAQGNTYKLNPFLSVDDYLEKSKIVELAGDNEEEKEGKTNVYNGTMGVIKATLDKTALIQFEDISGLIAIDQNGLDKIDMAYAATVHKLQGSGIKDVIFCLDYGAYKLLSRQLLYTGLTRASRKCVLLCENNAMFTAIQNDASGIRRTFLADIINNSHVK
jgi:exodeoxyribonuclease V alpha subunit